MLSSLWERMREAGFIWLSGSYDGWYCIHEETFFTETQVEKADEEAGCKWRTPCPDCHRELERVSEDLVLAFHSRTSCLSCMLSIQILIEPDSCQRGPQPVESGLQDISVSRTSFDWGVPVPFDESHATLCLDALLNYYTGCYYDDSPEAAAMRKRFWPAQMHVVGKDIRFHCVIWPAMLMAPRGCPGAIFAHGLLNVRNLTGVVER